MATRHAFRLPPLRRAAAAKLASAAETVRPSLLCQSARRTRPLARFLRRPVELGACVETLLPMHSATASALMTSMLTQSRHGYGWLAEAGNDDM